MKKNRKHSGYWTKEVCEQESLKYTTKEDFKKGCNGAYQKAYKNGWMESICSHMNSKNKHWTYDMCKEIALTYQNRTEMYKNECSCFIKIYKSGWDKELFSHMPYLKKHNYWEKEVCIEESLKYDNLRDFKKGCPSALVTMRKNGWLSEVKHFKPLGNLYKRYIYSIEFSDKSVYVGLSYDIYKRLRQHILNEGTVSKHIKNSSNLTYKLKKLSEETLEISEAQKEERFWITKYEELGWSVINKNKGGAIGSKIRKWNLNTLTEVALKYSSIKEFRSEDSSAYSSAKSLKLLDEICKHMKRKDMKPSGYWTFDKCKECALSCLTRKEFYLEHGSAYSKALKMGWINDITSHFKKAKV